jgi:undecaprenyl-diphosphatase
MTTAAERRRTIAQVWSSLDRADALLLISLLIVVLCAWIFFKVADEVVDQDVQKIDEKILHALREPTSPNRPIGPRWLQGAVRDITALGSAPVLVLFVLSVAGALAARRQYHALWLLLGATLGGRLLNVLLKAVFARPRPDVALRLTEVDSMSFPSGHAMDSAIIYLTLAALLTRLVQPAPLKLYLLGLALLITLLIGLSRIYLGVHYPSDVLAGWVAGLAWALLCWTVATYLQSRGAVEQAK